MSSNNALVAKPDYLSYGYGLVIIAGGLIGYAKAGISYFAFTIFSLQLISNHDSFWSKAVCRRSRLVWFSARRPPLAPIKCRRTRAISISSCSPAVPCSESWAPNSTVQENSCPPVSLPACPCYNSVVWARDSFNNVSSCIAKLLYSGVI